MIEMTIDELRNLPLSKELVDYKGIARYKTDDKEWQEWVDMFVSNKIGFVLECLGITQEECPLGKFKIIEVKIIG